MGAALLVLCWALLAIDRPAGLGDVTDVRHWSYPDYTRVVVELDRPVSIKTDVRHLPANPTASRPERLYLDLEGIWVGRLYLEGQARSYSDVDKIAAALREQQGFVTQQPRNRKRADKGVDFIIQAELPSGEGEPKGGGS